MVRWLAVVVAVLAVLFLIGGWYYSGQIQSGALAPPSDEPPTYGWEVTNASSTSVSLKGSSDTDQAGQAGLSAIEWESGSAQSSRLLSSADEDGGVVDVRSLEPGNQPPAVGTDVLVDQYYWNTDPLQAHGMEFENIFYSSNISSFPAWYIEGTTDTWAIVVHGKGGTLAESLRILPTLKDLGYHIMVISYRNDVGEARDPSGYFTYGETDWADLAAAVTYARAHGARDHVLVGYSYAGTIISNFLTEHPLRNSTKAAILDSPVLSLSDTVDFRASQTSLPIIGTGIPDALTGFAKWIASWRFDTDWAGTDYLSKTAQMHTPLLIFHGTPDTSVPYATSKELAETRPDITTLITTDAGHTRSWNLDPAAYDQAIKEFLSGLDG